MAKIELRLKSGKVVDLLFLTRIAKDVSVPLEVAEHIVPRFFNRDWGHASEEQCSTNNAVLDGDIPGYLFAAYNIGGEIYYAIMEFETPQQGEGNIHYEPEYATTTLMHCTRY